MTRVEEFMHLLREHMDVRFPNSLVGMWSTEPDTVRVVFRFPPEPDAHETVYGIVRKIEADVDLDLIVNEVVDYEIGEPLAVLGDNAWIECGVLWVRNEWQHLWY